MRPSASQHLEKKQRERNMARYDSMEPAGQGEGQARRHHGPHVRQEDHEAALLAGRPLGAALPRPCTSTRKRTTPAVSRASATRPTTATCASSSSRSSWGTPRAAQWPRRTVTVSTGSCAASASPTCRGCVRGTTLNVERCAPRKGQKELQARSPSGRGRVPRHTLFRAGASHGDVLVCHGGRARSRRHAAVRGQVRRSGEQRARPASLSMTAWHR
jgi:hypothetical protein